MTNEYQLNESRKLAQDGLTISIARSLEHIQDNQIVDMVLAHAKSLDVNDPVEAALKAFIATGLQAAYIMRSDQHIANANENKEDEQS